LFVLIFVLLVLLVYPFKTTVVPDWSLRVVDDSGVPVPSINATEHWQHYLLENSAHEELRQTGADGSVSFPERTIRASVLRRFLATLTRFAQDGIRARRHAQASVVVWGSKSYATTVAVCQESDMPPAEIVVKVLR
jgi:hypothetical protein